MHYRDARASLDSPAVRDLGRREKVTSTVVFRVEGERMSKGESDREREKGVRD